MLHEVDKSVIQSSSIASNNNRSIAIYSSDYKIRKPTHHIATFFFLPSYLIGPLLPFRIVVVKASDLDIYKRLSPCVVV